jgi:hypothetical protein
MDQSEQYDLVQKGEGGIYTHANKNVDSSLGSRIIQKASETIWGKSRRCQGVQRVLLELMQNTHNHASLQIQGEKHWWLSVNHEHVSNKACFSFVDFGVGVFASLNNKPPKSKWGQWKEKMAGLFRNESDLLKLILDGKLHETVTGKKYRGKGLPGIADVMRRGHISRLHVITNKVYADVEQEHYRLLKSSFNGTFVYWELDSKNRSCSDGTT